MAFDIQANCNSCHYSVPNITVGDGKHILFICGNCRHVVNPQRIKYRLDCPNCPKCHQTLERSRMIEAGKIPSAWIGHPPIISEISCPQCNSGKLSFTRTMHMRIRPDFNPPDIGQRVHVRVDENGVLIAADIRQQIVIEEPFPEFNQSIVLDCEVFAVDSKQVVLKCVDTIMLAELPGYS